jgi:tetratricopeptide (TPR) repeat protein
MSNHWPLIAAGTLLILGAGVGVGVWKVRVRADEARADEARAVRTSAVTVVAPAPLPTGVPLLGVDGKSADGEPTQYVDRPALRSLLARGHFADLTRDFERLEADFEADPSRECWPMDAADAFASAEPELQGPLDTWVTATPQSFAPYLARATYWKATAHARRGGKVMKDTPEVDRASMEDAVAAARADLTRALAARPNLVAARRLQIQLDMLTGSRDDARAAVDAATATCPTCFQVRVTYLFSLTPRWGGTYEAMSTFAGAAPVAGNPRLRLLAGYADHDRARVLHAEKRFDEARAAIERATALGAHWEFLVERAKVDSLRGDVDHAVADLDRAALLRPGLPEVLFERAWAQMDKKRWEPAGLDLLAGMRVDPTDARARQMHPTVVKGLIHAAAEAHHAGRREDALRLIDLAAELGPTDHDVHQWKEAIVSGKSGPPAASDLEPLEKAARDQPDDFRAHQQLDYALARQGQMPRVIEMWTEYLSRHPNDGPAHLERGGAYVRLRKLAEAQEDAAKACELSVSEGCVRQKQITQMRGR